MLIKNYIKEVTSFAPASSANLNVGFDILGVALKDIGDTITLKKRIDKKIIIKNIYGVQGYEKLPLDINKNVCSAILIKMQKDLKLNIGFDIYLKKGVPLSSGLGGSSSSCVATVIACNEFLENPLTNKELINFATYGEYVATGNYHSDNVVPSLLGGLCLVKSCKKNPEIIKLPSPNIYITVCHPNIKLDTKTSREVLQEPYYLKEIINQTSNLACFIAGLYKNDIDLIIRNMKDILILDKRKGLIPYFDEIYNLTLKNNGLICGISGSGSSIFSISKNKKDALNLGKISQKEFLNYKINSNYWVSSFNEKGAFVLNK